MAQHTTKLDMYPVWHNGTEGQMTIFAIPDPSKMNRGSVLLIAGIKDGVKFRNFAESRTVEILPNPITKDYEILEIGGPSPKMLYSTDNARVALSKARDIAVSEAVKNWHTALDEVEQQNQVHVGMLKELWRVTKEGVYVERS